MDLWLITEKILKEITFPPLCLPIYSGAPKFVNPFDLVIFLHKYDLKHMALNIDIIYLNKWNKISLLKIILFTEENDLLHIYVWQKSAFAFVCGTK